MTFGRNYDELKLTEIGANDRVAGYWFDYRDNSGPDTAVRGGQDYKDLPAQNPGRPDHSSCNSLPDLLFPDQVKRPE